MKRERSSFYLFAVSFFTSLGILLLVMAVVFSLTVEGEEPVSQPSDLSVDQYRPSAEDAFSILIMGETEGQLSQLALLSFDPMAVEICLTRLDPETEVELDGRTDDLLGHDAYAGSEEVVRGVSALGYPVDRYLRIGRQGAINLIDSLGGMEWEFSEPLQTSRLNIPVGRHLLDGETVLTIMEESRTLDTVPQGGKVALSLLGQRLTESLLNRGDWFFQLLMSNTQSDISQLDYASHKKMLRWYLTRENHRFVLETETASI